MLRPSPVVLSRKTSAIIYRYRSLSRREIIVEVSRCSHNLFPDDTIAISAVGTRRIT